MADSEQETLRTEVAEALGYSFEDPDLLRDALTHRSFRNEQPHLAPRDNERLEFLGDAVLGMCIASLLFEEFPEAPEGELTKKRAAIVCESGLEAVAASLHVGPALRLGKGEERSGGREKSRLLASSLEAIIGAMFLDGGIEATLEVIARLFAEQVATATLRRDDKSAIQELVQARRGQTPTYRLIKSEGPDHDRRFTVAIEVEGEAIAQGVGRSKSEAEQSAARAALEELGEQS